VSGKILIVDTMLDVANIREAFQSAEWVEFFKKARLLITAHGCEGIVLIAHPTKSSQKSTNIDPGDYLKDSVTFGGKIDLGFAFRKVDGTAKVHVERIKGRGFEEQGFKFSIAATPPASRISRRAGSQCAICQKKRSASQRSKARRPVAPAS